MVESLGDKKDQEEQDREVFERLIGEKVNTQETMSDAVYTYCTVCIF